MYVRHNAWLNATPEGQKGEPRNRRSHFVEGDPILNPPPLSGYEAYLVELWREAGTVSQKGMGIDALDWTELIAWSERFYSETIVEWMQPPAKNRRRKLRGKLPEKVPILIKYCTLPDIDLQIIRQMSQEYAWMVNEASDPQCPCPKEMDEADKEVPQEIEEDMAVGVLDTLRAMGLLSEDESNT